MDQVSEVREKIDIVSFISEYLPLKKLGRNFKANCPFHNEHTPSFVVSPERQIWHCFGCGKGGDVFTFLMEYENMEFPESLRALAKKAGVTLRENSFQKNEYSDKEKIYTINNQTLKFYKYILNTHPAGKKALDYLLKTRKISKALIDTFEMGFSPNTGSSLSDYLINKKGYKNKDLILAGVSFDRNGKLYDFFRGRVIFPLHDHRGNVTGFSARGITDDQTPKYINTRETAVYHKGSMFFGLNSAKDEIKLKQDAIIVEGEFDTISLFSVGIKNVVAIKGTALTEGQVVLLSRFTPKVTLCLDQDSAGFEATKRSLEVLEKKGLTASIIVLKDAKDPDEAIKSNEMLFKKELKESVGIYDYLIDVFLSKNDKKSAEGKKNITDNLLPLFANISNEVVKEHYIKKLSLSLDISFESLNKEIDKLKKVAREDSIIIPKKTSRTRRELLEEYMLSLIIQNENPKEILEENKNELLEYKFETLTFGKILQNLFTFFETHDKFEEKIFSNTISNELIKYFDTCFIFPLPKFASEEKASEEVKKVARELLYLYIKDRVKILSDEIKTSEKEKSTEKTESLKKEFARLLLLMPKNKVQV